MLQGFTPCEAYRYLEQPAGLTVCAQQYHCCNGTQPIQLLDAE